MTPDKATFLLEIFLPSVTEEWQRTKKILRALKAGEMDHRPDPKARSAAELAWHIVSSDIWFLEGVTKGEFSMDDKNQPKELQEIEDMISWYEAAVHPLLEKLRSMDGATLAKPISFFGLLDQPAILYLPLLQHHSIHHRGQLSTYLRPMGGTVPAIYGGSADEPFAMPD